MQVTFLPANVRVEAEPLERLSDVLDRAGLTVDRDCGGSRTCGKCRVLLSKGNDHRLTPEEQSLLSFEEAKIGIRLACCVRITEDSCVILDEPRTEDGFHKQSAAAGRRTAVVMDIGTTTLELLAFDPEDGRTLFQASRLNPQTRHGADIISRLMYSGRSQEHKAEMHILLVHALDDILRECGRSLSIGPERFSSITAAGNTVMSHFFAGKPAGGLLKAPFIPGYRGDLLLSAGKLGFSSVAPDCPVYLPANLGGYVGSDSWMCLLAVQPLLGNGADLILDIGTNGEMILVRDGCCKVCSVAAGPAFEGASVSQGMRCENGAIDRVEHEDGKLVSYVKGSGKAKGICGSGLIDCAASMLELGIMDRTGYIRETDGERTAGITIAVNDDGTKIRITQADIRKLQMAKGAVRAGIEVLLESEGLSDDDLEHIFLAGNFGGGLNIINAAAIGLLPYSSPDRTVYIGNGVLNGGRKLLPGGVELGKVNKMAEAAEHLELAMNDSFRGHYVAAMDF